MRKDRTFSALRWLIPGLLLIGIALALPHDPGLPCRPEGPSACASCHVKDLAAQFPSHEDRPCSPYCLTCHFKENKDQHHSVGTPLRKKPSDARLLTEQDHTGCRTCHGLATPRYDQVRWKAESLFDRVFRSHERYKTYLLTYRNDRGQLCLACH